VVNFFCKNSDSSKVKEAVEKKGRQGHHKLSKRWHINFVIFVINIVAMQKILHCGENLSRPNFMRTFKFPLISFKGQSHTHIGAPFVVLLRYKSSTTTQMIYSELI
jgi:hypothetical protein